MSLEDLPALSQSWVCTSQGEVAGSRPNKKPMSNFVLEYVESETQKRLALSEGEVVPLGFDDLVALHGRLRDPISFPLKVRGARVESSDFDHIDCSQRLTFSADLQSNHGSTVLALVNGGWLPSGLALDDEILLLPDRCTVAAIRSRFVGGARKDGLKDDFLEFARGKRLRINPMLYAMEGKSGRLNPTESELSELFDRAAEKILEALPNAVVFPEKVHVMRGAMGLLNDMADGFAARQRFLVKAAPLIATPVRHANLQRVWFQLMDLRERYGVPKASMLVCALLSASAARPAMNPAQALLKPRRNYTDKNAFNALADLRALDLLIAAGADSPEQRVALLTEDRALALYWTGLQINSLRRDGSNIHYAINPHRALFGRLSEQEQSNLWRLTHGL
jgi:hypothetical protein